MGVRYKVRVKDTNLIHDVLLPGCARGGEVYQEEKILYKILTLDRRKQEGESIFHKDLRKITRRRLNRPPLD